jgi:hypothetical protein
MYLIAGGGRDYEFDEMWLIAVELIHNERF